MLLSQFKNKDLKAACKLIGAKQTGDKDELISRLCDWLCEAAWGDVVAAVAASDVIASCLPFAYRPTPASRLVENMATHNGYCTDSVQYVGEEPRAGSQEFQYQACRGFDEAKPIVYVAYWFQGRKIKYNDDQTVQVSVRWLIEHDAAV